MAVVERALSTLGDLPDRLDNLAIGNAWARAEASYGKHYLGDADLIAAVHLRP